MENLPKCDLCDLPAQYRYHDFRDGQTHYVCRDHFHPNHGEGWQTDAEELFSHEEITQGNPMKGSMKEKR